MKVYEIVEATQGILVSGNKDDEINLFSQDSRQMTNGTPSFEGFIKPT